MQAIINDNRWIYLGQAIEHHEKILTDHFSVKHPKSVYINDTSQQSWDGWYRKYDSVRKRIALPLLNELKQLCIDNDIPLSVIDKRVKEEHPVDINELKTDLLKGITLEDHQMRAIKAACENECGLISIITGGGKCLGRGTPVIMFDGSIKPVEQINVGDLLMGDDSTPREVLSLCNGIENLYRVVQKNGDPYVVNESHILSLKISDKIVDVSLLDYYNGSKSFRNTHGGYKVYVGFKNGVPFVEKQLSYGIKIEPIGPGEYFGFEIDGNKRFLLGDFTVTHNTEVAAGITKLYKLPTVIIANQRVVIEQLKERLELREVGNPKDGKNGIGLFYGGETPDGQTVVVGSIQSLQSPPISLKKKKPDQYASRKRNAELFQAIVGQSKLLLVDECDLATDKRYRNLFFKYYNGRYKFGFSGTCFDPDKPVEALVLKEHLGSVIVQVDRRELESIGRIIPVKAVMMSVGDQSGRSDKTAYDIAQRELMIENPKYHELIKRLVESYKGERNLILIDTHNIEDLGTILQEKIENSVFIYGASTKRERDSAINNFTSGKLSCLIGGKILKRGLDIKDGIHNLIICGGGKLVSDFDQKVGRAVRNNDRGWARLICFFHLDNYYLYKHSKQQLKTILSLGYKCSVVFDNRIIVSGQELIDRKFKIPKESHYGRKD